jgi:hypothetical protein
VSADERYLLYLDGKRIGRGPECGSDRIWFYESYDLELGSGPHTLVAIVWQLGEIGPLAQVGLAGGFLLEADGPIANMISTKSGGWDARQVKGMSFSLPELPSPATAWFVEPNQTTDGSEYPWGIEKGEGEGWEPVLLRPEDFTFPFGIHATHNLQPALLPAQLDALRHGGRVRYVGDKAWSDPPILLCLPTGKLIWRQRQPAHYWLGGGSLPGRFRQGQGAER